MKATWVLDEKWGEYRCSACGIRTYIRSKNCKNCGRKMEKAKDEKPQEKTAAS